MVVGIVLLPLGLKKVQPTSAARATTLTDPFRLPLSAMYAGGRCSCWRTSLSRTASSAWSTSSAVVTAVLLLVLIPLAAHLPAIGALALLTA